jgi:hypothetical protein
MFGGPCCGPPLNAPLTIWFLAYPSWRRSTVQWTSYDLKRRCGCTPGCGFLGLLPPIAIQPYPFGQINRSRERTWCARVRSNTAAQASAICVKISCYSVFEVLGFNITYRCERPDRRRPRGKCRAVARILLGPLVRDPDFVFAQEAEMRAQGLKFRIYPNSSLNIKPRETLDALQNGKLEMAVYPLVLELAQHHHARRASRFVMHITTPRAAATCRSAREPTAAVAPGAAAGSFVATRSHGADRADVCVVFARH